MIVNNQKLNFRLLDLEKPGYVACDGPQFKVLPGHMVVGVRSSAGPVRIILSWKKLYSGKPVAIKDEGKNALTNNITVIPEPRPGNITKIDGSPTFVINANGGHVALYPAKGQWHVLHTGAPRLARTARITASTTLDETYHHVFCDTDDGALTVTLPAGVAGRGYRIINTGGSGNDVTVTPDGAELLIGVNGNQTLTDGDILTIVYETTEGWW